ncbi:MAG: mechanosensitive ion channel family protein [Planctomycetota bacterium]|nr:mechanosensitive ion channel family protein [Planctomycetota bacterium]
MNTLYSLMMFFAQSGDGDGGDAGDAEIGHLTVFLVNLMSPLTENVWAQAGLVIAAALVSSKLFDWLCTGAFKTLTRKTRTKTDDLILKVMHAPVVNTVVLIGLAVASRLLGFEDSVATMTNRALLTIGLFVWAVFIFRLTGILLRAASSNPNRFEVIQASTFPLFNNLAKLLLFGVMVYLTIGIWNLDATGWLASAGVVGLAIGFAAQDTLSNLIAGVFILADRPYRVGDYIRLDSGERGQVTFIGLRSTRIVTRDDIEVTVPNSVMGGAKIVNESSGPHKKERIRIPVGAAYGSDVDQVMEVLLSAIEDIDPKLVCSDPEPRVRMRAFGGSSLDFELLVWIPDPELCGNVSHLLHRAVYNRFNQANIEIPFAKQDLYIKEMPESFKP